jgi:hypothetical protein
MEKNLYLFQLSVLFEKMKDPDIADSTEARDVVGFYEWALGDDIGIHTTLLLFFCIGITHLREHSCICGYSAFLFSNFLLLFAKLIRH